MSTLTTVALAGCTWGRSKPAECAAERAGPGFAELARLAALVPDTREIVINHSLCTSRSEAEAPLQDAIRAAGWSPQPWAAEIGRCFSVKTPVSATAEAARDVVGRLCDVAVATGTRYADWSTPVGGHFLFVSQDYVRAVPDRVEPAR